MEYDGIIVGGGHNGLICASYLAKAGLKIAVIERNDAMGGGCHTSEFVAPGSSTTRTPPIISSARDRFYPISSCTNTASPTSIPRCSMPRCSGTARR